MAAGVALSAYLKYAVAAGVVFLLIPTIREISGATGSKDKHNRAPNRSTNQKTFRR